MTRLYLDYAATTPVRPEVLDAMLPHFIENGYNPSSLHAEGRAARAALDRARASVAERLGARPREIVFTGGGSEADNLAIFGVARARKHEGRHLITSAIEHHAVLHAFEVLASDGYDVTVLPVDGEGRVSSETFARAIRPDTILASIMLANNELGTLQPIANLAAIARERGVVFHTDAVQAPGRVPLDAAALGADLIAFSAHKFYGPKGVGALYVRAGTPLAPLVVGGGQEAGLRAGTENVAGAVGFAKGFELATSEQPAEAERLRSLRDALERGLRRVEPGVRINGAGAERLPNVSNVAFPGVDAATLLARLDLDGVAVSSGSACAAGSTEPSHVIDALRPPDWVRFGAIRLSLGKPTSEQDVEGLVRMLPETLRAVRVDGTDVGIATLGSSLMDRSEVRF